jgi:chemotaxis protein CheZ
MSKKESYEISEVLKIVNNAVQGFDREKDHVTSKLYQELKELSHMIHSICHDGREIDSGKDHISKATDELDEVVKATEQATGKIMDSCETIQGHVRHWSDPRADDVNLETVKIFEACSFQDITGQRVSTAVSAIYEIEKRIDAMLELLSGPVQHTAPRPQKANQLASEEWSDESLMNGPQMPENAMTQEDIDRLLNE